MAALPDARHFFRGDDGYEPARRATVWNQRVPDRYPDVIVQAVDAEDVVATVRYAKPTARRSASSPAATAGRPTICATARCCST